MVPILNLVRESVDEICRIFPDVSIKTKKQTWECKFVANDFDTTAFVHSVRRVNAAPFRCVVLDQGKKSVRVFQPETIVLTDASFTRQYPGVNNPAIQQIACAYEFLSIELLELHGVTVTDKHPVEHFGWNSLATWYQSDEGGYFTLSHLPIFGTDAGWFDVLFQRR